MKDCFVHYCALRREMSAWLAQSRQMDPPGRHGGGEDEANYALAWFPHYLVTGSAEVRAHFEYLLDQLAGWVARECVHGYEGEAEAHHGTEPFLLFLPRYLGLFPDDARAKDLLADAAEHIGNWAPGVPEWFDWERLRFRGGYYIGTKVVGKDSAFDCELAEHMRFVHIALAAHRVTGDGRYLDWALAYGRRRAQMIAAAPVGPLPLCWDAQGHPVWPDEATEAQRRAAQAGHHVKGDPLIGVEVLLASGVIYALGDLFLASGESVFCDAARRIAEPLVGELLDPYADPGATAVGYYRQTFGDKGLDETILEQVSWMPPQEEGEWAMVFPQGRRRDWPGVGKRNDMTYWGRWGSDGSVTPTREPSTAALALAFQMTGDADYAERALSQASAKLAMARRVLRGGREHADMGGAVCSIAAGHGRSWGTGPVTGCYGPLLLGTREVKGQVMPALVVRRNEDMGLPESVLSLVQSPQKAVFYNGGKEEVSFEWRWEQGDWQSLVLRQDEQKEIGA